MDNSTFDVKYWSGLYNQGAIGWNVGEPTTPIKTYIDQIENKKQRILVPGAGYGHEVVYLASQGFSNITVIDLVQSALDKINEALPLDHKVDLIEGDFFSHKGIYDLVVEQTFFCAIDPSLREGYAKHMQSILAKQGKLVGLFFNRVFDRQGPPFGGSIFDYETLFKPYFSNIQFEECYNSIPSRQGSECFGILEK